MRGLYLSEEKGGEGERVSEVMGRDWEKRREGWETMIDLEKIKLV